jgi:hypothetical protein
MFYDVPQNKLPRGLLTYLFDKGFRATLEQLQNSEGPKSVEFWNDIRLANSIGMILG